MIFFDYHIAYLTFFLQQVTLAVMAVMADGN